MLVWSAEFGTVELHLPERWLANYPDRLGPSGKFVENSTKLTCLEITVYRVKYRTLLWLLELQIRLGRKVQTQVHTVNSKSRNSTAIVAYFNWKIHLFGFPAYPDASPPL
jgi:hypothetical protein